jgi:hypothetical protein
VEGSNWLVLVGLWWWLEWIVIWLLTADWMRWFWQITDNQNGKSYYVVTENCTIFPWIYTQQTYNLVFYMALNKNTYFLLKMPIY